MLQDVQMAHTKETHSIASLVKLLANSAQVLELARNALLKTGENTFLKDNVSKIVEMDTLRSDLSVLNADLPVLHVKTGKLMHAPVVTTQEEINSYTLANA